MFYTKFILFISVWRRQTISGWAEFVNPEAEGLFVDL